MCCSGGPTSIRNQNFRLVPFLASATSRSSSTPETPLHTHNYLPTHRASGSLQTALSKVLRNQASAQSNFICRNTSDRELALIGRKATRHHRVRVTFRTHRDSASRMQREGPLNRADKRRILCQERITPPGYS